MKSRTVLLLWLDCAMLLLVVLSGAPPGFKSQGRSVSLSSGLRELSVTAATLATFVLIGRLVLRLRL